MGGVGGGGCQLFNTEFGKLCVPLKKSWLRPCPLCPGGRGAVVSIDWCIKDGEVSDLKIQLDELRLKLSHEEKAKEELQKHYQQVLNFTSTV